MKNLHWHTFAAFLGWAQAAALPTEDCPLLGPAFPSYVDNGNSDIFKKAVDSFPKAIDGLLTSGVVSNTTSSIVIDVFSTHTGKTLYNYTRIAPQLPSDALTAGKLDLDTIYRTGSVSKLFTVYALLIKGGFAVFEDPVTKWVPELKASRTEADRVTKIFWEDITVGALASQMGGTGGFDGCESTLFSPCTTHTDHNDSIPSMAMPNTREGLEKVHNRP